VLYAKSKIEPLELSLKCYYSVYSIGREGGRGNIKQLYEQWTRSKFLIVNITGKLTDLVGNLKTKT